MYRTYVYQCWGSRSRSRYGSTARSSALGEERAGVIDCGHSPGDDIIPDTGMYVPGTRYIFCHRGLHCQGPVYVVCTRYCIGGLHENVPYVDHCSRPRSRFRHSTRCRGNTHLGARNASYLVPQVV